MKTTLMQRIAAALVVSAALAGGRPAAAEEPAAAAAPRLTLEGVPLAGVLRADPRGAHAAAGLLARAGGAEQLASSAKDGGERARRMGRGAAVGAGVGAVMGYFSGQSWCANESGGNCNFDPLTLGFTALGAIAGAGIGAALGAIGGK